MSEETKSVNDTENENTSAVGNTGDELAMAPQEEAVFIEPGEETEETFEEVAESVNKAPEAEEAVETSDIVEKADDEDFDIMSIFAKEAKSTDLGAGVHENIRLISVDPKRRKDSTGKLVKKQLFLRFKRFNVDDEDMGEKEISFFIVDPARDTAVKNLGGFFQQLEELLGLYFTEEEIEAGFDPIGALFRDAVANDAALDFKVLKKEVLKKSSAFSKAEQEACDQFATMMLPKIGFDSEAFRLKLEDSKDAKYVQIPAFERFVEKSNVEKEKSELYN